MKKLLLCIGLIALTVSPLAMSRDVESMRSIKDAMNAEVAKEKLGNEVRFYFGNSKTPTVKRFYAEAVANRKTNSFNKSDAKACDWAFLSAMLALRDRAVREGANAVVDITSYYKRNENSSRTEYECHAGGMITGVALKGRIVKL